MEILVAVVFWLTTYCLFLHSKINRHEFNGSHYDAFLLKKINEANKLRLMCLTECQKAEIYTMLQVYKNVVLEDAEVLGDYIKLLVESHNSTVDILDKYCGDHRVEKIISLTD